MTETKRVYAVGTMDSKGEELAYLAAQVRAAGAAVVTVDVGTQSDPTLAGDVSRRAVASAHCGLTGPLPGSSMTVAGTPSQAIFVAEK